MDRIARAVAGYVAGAGAIALIAGTLTFIVLTILGVPFAGPLAVLAGFMSLIPLIGATIAAVIIGIVTLFNDFPTDTIVWTVWAIVYQQLENNLVQPQIQKRTVDVQPFVVLTAVLFGSALLGVLGALVAIPVAASIQIIVREWWAWRQEERSAGALDAGRHEHDARQARRAADRALARLSGRRRYFLRRPKMRGIAAIPPPITKPATAAPISTFCWFLTICARQSVARCTSPRRRSTAAPSSRRCCSMSRRISSGERCVVPLTSSRSP